MGLTSGEIAVIAIIAILTIIGLALSIFILPALVSVYKTTRQPFYILMISLSVPEIIWLFLTVIYSIPTLILGSSWFGQMTERIMGNIDTIVYFMQLTHLFFISVNRLRFVSRSSLESFDKVFTAKKIIIWSTVLWLFSIGNGVLLEACSCQKYMNNFYWSTHCLTNSTVSDVGKMINATLSNFFPIISAIIYIMMWAIIKWKQNKIAANLQQSWKKNVSLIIQFSVVTGCLIIESMAYWVLPIFFDDVQISAVAHIFAVFCGSINPYIYLLFNHQIRNCVKGWFGSASVEPMATTMNLTQSFKRMQTIDGDGI